MKAVLQRVKSASVTVEGEVVGRIGAGFLILLGVGETDERADMAYLLEKIPALRVFMDDQEKMNLSLLDTGGEALVVSQFTLYADTSRGRRPSFTLAAKPDKARAYYEEFVEGLKSRGVHTETGVFGAHMDVELVNDGPVTIILESPAG